MSKSSEIVKSKKSIYERPWFWILAIIGGVMAILFIGNIIGSIADPEVKIPDVKGLTKTEACSKIESAGLTCKIGYDYDPSNSDQKVYSFLVYDKNGNTNYSASDSLRAKKSSTISLNFEETEKQKAEREEKEAKYKAEKAQEEAKKKAEENAKKQDNSSVANSNQKSNASWREFIAEYESFMNKYVDFMKKYKANPSDATLIADYGKIVQQYSEFTEKANSLKGGLSGSDLTEYLNALSRITQRVSEL